MAMYGGWTKAQKLVNPKGVFPRSKNFEFYDTKLCRTTQIELLLRITQILSYDTKFVFCENRPLQNSISLGGGPFSLLLTHCWMYLRRKDCALRLSTGQLKKPWISFCHRSTVITWLRPALKPYSQKSYYLPKYAVSTKSGQCPMRSHRV
jgi:hypothetical protein